MNLVLAAVLGYLNGSIPFGLLFTRAAGLGDVRSIGSGNIGATNVLRTGNKKVAALTLLFDALKGFVPVIIAQHWLGPTAAVVAGLAAIAGHLFPVWLGFKGGKGVATNIGVLFALYWPLGLAFLAVWLGLAFLIRISSLSALVAAAASPLWAWLLGRADLVVPVALVAAVIFFTHRANIARLMAGTEPKISLGKKAE
jgi:glycerol-3-phosphate acyltransferase PlsY